LLFCFDIHIAGFVPARKAGQGDRKPLITIGFIKIHQKEPAKPVRIPGMLLRGMSGNPARRAMKNGACLSTCAVFKVLRSLRSCDPTEAAISVRTRHP
jgi:hypothetical protein